MASTKAFTTQLASFLLLTVTLAKMRHKLSIEDEQRMIMVLRHLPVALQHALQVEPQVRIWAKSFAQKRHALFLVRGVHYPVAMEGALLSLRRFLIFMLKPYAAGELKHGPLPLVDSECQLLQ